MEANFLITLKRVYERYGISEMDRLCLNYLAKDVLRDAEDFYEIPEGVDARAVSGMLIDDFTGVADWTFELERHGIKRKK